MPLVHEIIGFAVAALFAVICVWGLVCLAIHRDPGKHFWLPIAFVQVAIGLQIIVGVLLVLLGYELPELLHMGYGIFCVAALVWAHIEARRRPRPWVPFVWATGIAFMLSLRALQTGLMG